MKSSSTIQRTSVYMTSTASIAFRIMIAILSWFSMTGALLAAVAEGSEPKEWPADPAKHKVVIKREAADKQQAAMIAAAEAAPISKESLLEAAGDAPVPSGDNVWWGKELLGVRIPCAITADAVTYYSDLVTKYGKQALKRYTQPSSSLNYHASVKFHQEFKSGDKAFKNVHVVTLKLTFSQNFVATTTEGMHFQKERVVVLDPNGKVLHVVGDGLTEVPILAI